MDGTLTRRRFIRIAISTAVATAALIAEAFGAVLAGGLSG
jgi:hypothetical protein